MVNRSNKRRIKKKKERESVVDKFLHLIKATMLLENYEMGVEPNKAYRENKMILHRLNASKKNMIVKVCS